MSETRYEHRTDSVEEKLRLLSKAHQEGNLDFAMSLAESVRDTLSLERQVQGEEGNEVVGADTFGEVGELPAAWAEWARGWPFYKVVGLSEHIGLERVGEPVDVVVGFGAGQAVGVALRYTTGPT